MESQGQTVIGNKVKAKGGQRKGNAETVGKKDTIKPNAQSDRELKANPKN